jgi:hypothetical protein
MRKYKQIKTEDKKTLKKQNFKFGNGGNCSCGHSGGGGQS